MAHVIEDPIFSVVSLLNNSLKRSTLVVIVAYFVGVFNLLLQSLLQESLTIFDHILINLRERYRKRG